MSQVPTAVSGVIINSEQAYRLAQPLAGDTGETLSSVSPWTLVPAGSFPKLALTLTSLTPNTTFSALLETVHAVDDTNTEIDSPRIIGYFQQDGTAALPATTQLSGALPTDKYVRVRTSVGARATAVWQVTGQFIAAAYYGGL
jgi:hypothetical protein